MPILITVSGSHLPSRSYSTKVRKVEQCFRTVSTDLCTSYACTSWACTYHGLMDKDVVELMKLHEELANIRHGQKINSGQRQA